jgi:hypothetical protein
VSAEDYLRREKVLVEGAKKDNAGVSIIKVHYKHVRKYKEGHYFVHYMLTKSFLISCMLTKYFN